MKTLRNLYYDYYDTFWFTLALLVSVPLSYYLSQFIPADLFENTISPMLHFAILLVTVLSAIQMCWHIDGIQARRVWRRVLVAWTVFELLMFALDYFFEFHLIIFDTHVINSEDLVVRNLFALLLLAYPTEVLLPRWLTVPRSVLILLPAILIHMIGYYFNVDLRTLLIGYPIVITVVLFVKVHAYQRRCEENYSSLDNTGVRWVRNYLICLAIIGISYFYLCFTNHPTRLFTQQWLILFLFAYNTTQIISRKRPWSDTPTDEDFSDDSVAAQAAEAEQNADADISFPPEFRKQLEQWMAENKPYLDKDFRLVDIMQVLPMNRTYLSRYINSTYGCSFSQFVTNYRIEEAKRLLSERPDMRLHEVAESSGFSSAAVFTRTFTKETGYSPTDWQKSQNLPD